MALMGSNVVFHAAPCGVFATFVRFLEIGRTDVRTCFLMPTNLMLESYGEKAHRRFDKKIETYDG